MPVQIVDIVAGADVVEVAPVDDHAEITTVAAATVVHDLVALMANRRLTRSGPRY